MTEAEIIREGAHETLDACFDALAKLDSGGEATVKWGKAITALLAGVITAACQRRFGRALLEAHFSDGLPTPQRAIDAGFITSVK